MSGGACANQEEPAKTPARGASVEELLDEEMKVDTPVTPRTPCGSTLASGLESSASSRSNSRPGSASETTWNFVQMNMTLLPIARPLPVSVPGRIHEGLTGRKPRTPNQKLHHRVLRSASNISPRHHEDNMLRRRGSTSSENGTSASSSPFTIPRPMVAERQSSAPLSSSAVCGKRKSDDGVDQPVASPWPSPTMFARTSASSQDDDNRVRSFSEELTMSSGTASDGDADAKLDNYILSRSASTSAAAFAHRGALFKDKRILEIQDEERRLRPNERAGLASPSKRSRRR